MDHETAGKISRERFAEWADTCQKNTATPALCVAIGHGTQSGVIHVLVPDGLARPHIVSILETALRRLALGQEDRK